jgi:ribonucleoside-diphosphate reductase alpha chain
VDVVDPLYVAIQGSHDEQERSNKLFRRAYQINPADHLRIQGVFQKHVDNAVSKTINLPQGATVNDVLNIYLDAHRMGLKGVTVFRDKSRESQILSCGAHQSC